MRREFKASSEWMEAQLSLGSGDELALTTPRAGAGDHQRMPSHRLPHSVKESPDEPESTEAQPGRPSADVRPLTTSELESMRDEFRASAEWADRQLAQQALLETGKLDASVSEQARDASASTAAQDTLPTDRPCPPQRNGRR